MRKMAVGARLRPLFTPLSLPLLAELTASAACSSAAASFFSSIFFSAARCPIFCFSILISCSGDSFCGDAGREERRRGGKRERKL